MLKCLDARLFTVSEDNNEKRIWETIQKTRKACTELPPRPSRCRQKLCRHAKYTISIDISEVRTSFSFVVSDFFLELTSDHLFLRALLHLAFI